MNGPLKGLLVVALEQAVAAPFCSSRLADRGARVIKVERIEGDFARHYDAVVQGQSAYFVWLNRGKESICLDIKVADDKAFLLNIIDRADVFIQNLSPGSASRAGFDSKQLRQRNPRLITVDISGYGDAGVYSQMKAYDLLVQCESGLASITGTPDAPGRVGISVCDIACGMYAHSAILEGLLKREGTGEGKGITVSLFDAIADWMTVPLLHYEYGGKAPERVGLNHPSIAPYGVYGCSDGKTVVIGIQNNREWMIFCERVLNRPELAMDERFKNNEVRCANRDSLNDKIHSVFGRLCQAEVLDLLRQHNIAFGSVNSVADLSTHSQLRRSNVDTELGTARLVSPPAQFTGLDDQLGKVPALGEHTEKIRSEFA